MQSRTGESLKAPPALAAVFATAVLATMPANASAADASGFPSRPIRIMVGYLQFDRLIAADIDTYTKLARKAGINRGDR